MNSKAGQGDRDCPERTSVLRIFSLKRHMTRGQNEVKQ